MGRAKAIVGWVLGLLLLLTAGTAVFLATAGDDFYRWAARQLLADAFDRPVHFDGTFSLDLGLEPTLVVTEVWIENAPWAENKEMARVERAEIQIALRPLFAGIVWIRRLVVQDLTLDLERDPDGTGNWEMTDGEPETVGQEDLFIPVLERISLTNVAVTYRGEHGGPDTVVLIDNLARERIAEETSFAIQGKGSLNQTPFRVRGRLGSVEKALTAAAPFPFEFTLDTVGVKTELKGTAENLPRAEGFDISLSARAPSIGRVLETWDSDLALEGHATATAALRGDLASLSVEDLAIEVVEESGQELRVEGSMSDLSNGKGLDLRFTAALDPEALRFWDDPPDELREILNGAEQLDVTGRITGDLEAPVLEDLHARLEHGSGADLSLRGGLALALLGEGATVTALQASTTISLPDAALLQQALGTRLPNVGAIDATAELTWEDGRIELRALEMNAASFGALHLTAEGRLAKLSAKGFDFAFDPLIDITASVDHSRPLIAFLARPTQQAETPSGNRVDDPSTRPSDPAPLGAPSSLSKEEAPGSSGENLVLSIQQRLRSADVDPGPLDGIMGPKTRAAIETYQARHGLAVDGRTSEDLLQHLLRGAESGRDQAGSESADTRSRDANLVDSLPELGAIRVSAQLSQSEGTYRLDDLRLTLGTKDALWVEVSGDLGTLRPGREAALEGLAVTVNFALPSSTILPELLPSGLPELKNLRGRFDVQGSPEAFSITRARIEVEGPDGLTGIANGQIASLSLLPEPTMKDLAFEVEARSPGTESVVQLVGLDLPELGPVRARGTLRDRGDLFALAPIDVWVGPPDRPVVHAAGRVGDVLAMKRIELSGDVRIAAATLLGPDVPVDESALGKVHGRFVVSDADGRVGIKALSAELKDTELLALSVEGLFDDIPGNDGLRFEVSLKVPDVSELGRELGLEVDRVGSLSFEGQVAGSDERFQAEGRFRLGETDFSGELTGSLVGKRPALRAKLYSPVLHLADLGLLPEPGTSATGAKKGGEDGKPARKWLFGEEPIAFGALKDFDLDLDVQLDQVKGVRLEIDGVEARLDLVDGLLRVDPLLLGVVGGRVDMRLLADARPKVPEVSLDIVADDVDLDDFLAQVEAAVPLAGQLNMIVHLKAAGLSPRSLAESLEGEFNLAIAQGQVLTSLLHATVASPLGWAVSRTARRGYSDLNCLVARFDVQKGLAQSVKLLLDTNNVHAEGAGTIDFRNERVDIGVHPRAKSRRLVSIATPFRIQGPLASPSVRVHTTGAVTRMVGNTLASPVNVLGSLLPLVSNRGRNADNPCLSLPDDAR